MAIYNGSWDQGEVKLYSSSGSTMADGDGFWNLGGIAVFHLYVAGGGVTGAVLKHWTGSAWTNVNLKRWDGATWAAVSLYYYNGTSFAAVQCNG